MLECRPALAAALFNPLFANSAGQGLRCWTAEENGVDAEFSMKTKTLLVAAAASALMCVPPAVADQTFVFNGVPWGTGGTNFFDPSGLIDTAFRDSHGVMWVAHLR